MIQTLGLSLSSSRRELDASLLLARRLISFLQVLKHSMPFDLKQTKLVISSAL